MTTCSRVSGRTDAGMDPRERSRWLRRQASGAGAAAPSPPSVETELHRRVAPFLWGGLKSDLGAPSARPSLPISGCAARRWTVPRGARS